MKNIDQHTLQKLKKSADEFYNIINQADTWVNSNLEKEQKEITSVRVKNSRRIVRKIINSIDSKPVFALFGASQVGKSYLIKNILSIDGAPLLISLGDEKIDFLKEINPPGTGAESTGVVTRFTIDSPSPNKDFPVKAKILNIKDILLIICDSFFSDLKTISAYPNTEEFSRFCSELKQRFNLNSTLQSVLSEDDIFDVKDYFEKHFYKFEYYTKHIDKSQFWFDVGKLINKIPSESWVDVFSILWNHNNHLSRLFSFLVQELKNLNFTSFLFLESSAVRRERGEILDVQRLKGLYTDQSYSKAIDVTGKTYNVSTSVISALSSEITLPCEAEIANQKVFLKNTDLLDFPGARSRLELTLESVSDDAIPDLLLRGKVSYLFNKYSADFEINNLLFCQNDKQLDVNELPSLLNDWIETNIGKNADERERNISNLPISPLFIIFTFFNNQLKYDITNDDKENIDYKWDTRFNRFFEQELVTVAHDWHTKWTSSNPLFKNFYLLRDFKYSEDTFSGFVEQNKEIGIAENRVEFLNRLKTSFLNHDFVNKHFSSPETSFEQAALPNMDGSDFIIKNLEPAANNFVKIKNYSTQLENIKSDFSKNLSKFHYTDNLDELRKKSISNSVKVQLELNKLFSQNPEKFSKFISCFMLDEVSVYNHLHDNLLATISQESNTSEYDLFKSSFPELNAEFSRQKNLEIIQSSLGLPTVDEVINMLEEQGLNLDLLFPKSKNNSAAKLLDGILSQWEEKSNDENTKEFISLGVSANTVKVIRETFLQTMEITEFKDFLLNMIKEKYQGISLDKHTEEYLAASITYSFNEFINQSGNNFMTEDTLENVKTLLPQLSGFIESCFTKKTLPQKQELTKLFNDFGEDKNNSGQNPAIDGYNAFISRFKIALLANCGFVNYDVEQNNLLENLLGSSKKIDFSFQ